LLSKGFSRSLSVLLRFSREFDVDSWGQSTKQA
jgi:hypothetical protein